MAPDFSVAELIIYAFASLGAAVLGGIVGGGAGFINVPLLIFFGLTPAQAVASSKLPGLSAAIASLGSLRSIPERPGKQLLGIVAAAVALGLLAPLVITRVDGELYRNLIGFLLLAIIPVLALKKIRQTSRNPGLYRRAAGYAFLVVALFLQAVFGAGLGVLVNIVLMLFLGMSALEANVTRRYSQVVLNAVIVVGLLFTGLIVWQVTLIGMATGVLGGYIGGRLALRNGNAFIIAVLAVLLFASGMALLFG